MTLSVAQRTDCSTRQLINRPIEQPTKQSINQSTTGSFNQRTNKVVSTSLNQSVNQATDRSAKIGLSRSRNIIIDANYLFSHNKSDKLFWFVSMTVFRQASLVLIASAYRRNRKQKEKKQNKKNTPSCDPFTRLQETRVTCKGRRTAAIVVFCCTSVDKTSLSQSPPRSSALSLLSVSTTNT